MGDQWTDLDERLRAERDVETALANRIAEIAARHLRGWRASDGVTGLDAVMLAACREAAMAATENAAAEIRDSFDHESKEHYAGVVLASAIASHVPIGESPFQPDPVRVDMVKP